ncbi:ABC transporter ATP-binding protein [Vallitalea sediminicola]
MLRYLQDKFAISDQGSKDLLKGILLSALENLALMLPVGLFVMLLDELVKPLFGAEYNSPNLIKYIILCIITACVIFVVHFYQYTSVYVSTYSESSVRRVTLAEKLRKLPLSFFGQRDLSDLTSTIMGDCASMEHVFSHALPQLIGAGISTIIVSIALLITDWRLGIALLWVVPVSLIMLFGSKHIQDKAGLKHLGAKRACTDAIQECIETVKEIKACNHEKNYLSNLDKMLDDEEKVHIKIELITASLITSSQMFLRLGFASVILVGSNLLVKGQIDFMLYLIFLIGASRIYDPLSGTLPNIVEIFNVRLQIKRMLEMENQPIQTGSEICKPNGYDIAFNNVTFAYNTGKKVLRNTTFTARQGEVTALVGPSGGGKSTAAKLAARFWDVNSGNITLGGIDVKTVEPETLLKNYSMVFQDVVLFHNTIMENIRIGRKNATDKEVIEAAKAAQCHSFIKALPDGYHTIVGENGSTLSGGERQRLSIARALLKDAPVILLDEATASLDVDNETQIQEAISELVKGKTVLVIAHRMRTIASADKIVVLENGTVAQQGSPQELMEQGGLYRHMVELQAKSSNWSLGTN